MVRAPAIQFWTFHEGHGGFKIGFRAHKKNCDENITMAKNFMSTKTKNQNTYCSHDETIRTTGKYFY